MSCMTPFARKDKMTNTCQAVPCGKCPDCKKRLVSGWSFRLMQEDKRSTSALFITLTYDTATVPITKNGFMELSKSHIQKFFKRLRKNHEGLHSTLLRNGTRIDVQQPIKYFCVGEYGGRTMRPHYHIILFNASIELIHQAWGYDKKILVYGEKEFKVRYHQSLGHIDYGNDAGVCGASIGYCLKYVMKPGKIPMHRNDDRQPEFRLMSKRLGENYLTWETCEWHLKKFLTGMYLTIEDGKKIAMPRYYKDKIYSEADRKQIGFFAKLDMEKRLLEAQAEKGETYYEELASIHQNQFQKMAAESTRNRNKL